MSEGLVTIAVAGDAAEADLILRTLAEVGINGRLEGAEGELGGAPHDQMIGRLGSATAGFLPLEEFFDVERRAVGRVERTYPLVYRVAKLTQSLYVRQELPTYLLLVGIREGCHFR